MQHVDASLTTSFGVAFVMVLFNALHFLKMRGSMPGVLTLSLSRDIFRNKSSRAIGV